MNRRNHETKKLLVRMYMTLKQTLSFGLLLIAVLEFQEINVISQPTPPVLSGLTSTSNGLALSWSRDTNTVYTIQTSSDLSTGTWSNATMRYRWPWPFTNWTDAPLTLRAPRFYRVMAETAAPPERGKLLSNGTISELSTNALQTILGNWDMSSFVTPNFPVGTLRFSYETIDPFGLPILASARLLFPENASGALPLLSVQHGTFFLKSDAKSSNTSTYGSGAAFATLGYVTVIPDFLGMGDSPGYQAYLHARSEATCVVDGLRAARTLCASNGLALSGQLFLFGYSQGGHVTMATHRELEAFHTNEFTLTASAPCAGAYDLGGITVESILANPNYPVPAYYPPIVASYLPIYNLGGSLEEIFAEPYRRTLPPLLDGLHTLSQVGAAMPSDMFKILRPDFQADFRTNKSNPLRLALSENNLYEWAPRAPMKMFHCRGDHVVIFANSEVAYQSFTNRGACCVEVIDPGAPSLLDHSPCVLPSLRGAMAWFQQLKQ